MAPSLTTLNVGQMSSYGKSASFGPFYPWSLEGWQLHAYMASTFNYQVAEQVLDFGELNQPTPKNTECFTVSLSSEQLFLVLSKTVILLKWKIMGKCQRAGKLFMSFLNHSHSSKPNLNPNLVNSVTTTWIGKRSRLVCTSHVLP